MQIIVVSNGVSAENKKAVLALMIKDWSIMIKKTLVVRPPQET